MKLKDDQKINASGQHSCATSNGSTLDQMDSVDLELQENFQDNNFSSSNEKQESISPIDTIAFNIEGIQTVVKNSLDTTEKSSFANAVSSENLLLQLQRYKEENVQLRAALKEASKVNYQWRSYHEKRQGYVQKLLSSLQDLQQSSSATQVEGKSSMEFQRLKDMFSRQQREHNEHVQLLQLQVRAHRDDWEAERTEKKAAEIGRIQAEAHLQILQKQLKEAASALAEMDARLKLCKCFAASARDQISPNERRAISSTSFHHQNGQTSTNECRASQSASSTPTFSSTNSSCNSTSRSSSVSKDFSTSSSPTISKNISSIGQNSDTSRISPSMRLHISKSSPRINENQDKPGMENTVCGSQSLACIQQEETDCGESSKTTDQNLSSKLKTKDNIDILTENTLQYYESKGARPKIPTGRGSDEEERKARHRARSILTSALPMSPSSSKPSSPVTVLSGKCSHNPKGCIPLTSPVMTPNKNKQTHVPGKLVEENASYNHSTESNVSTNVEKVNFHLPCTEVLAKAGKFGEPKLKDGSPKTTDDNSSLSSVRVNAIPSQLKGKNSASVSSIIESSKFQPIKEEPIIKNDFLDVKTASKMKQNSKSLTVTNNPSEKLNANHASITVMPSPSSALFSHTQGALTTSSRSSSPGISLTTFALNANGQGVPGAIFFALGPDHSPSTKHSGFPNRESLDYDSNDRIVNSTWVQLLDNENSPKNHSSSAPWRTARAISSHKLNSVRKPHSESMNSLERTSRSSLVPIPEDKRRNVESLHHKHRKNGNKKCVSNGVKHLNVPQQNEIRYHTASSPPPSYTSNSRDNQKFSVFSNPSSLDNALRNVSSPTICINPNVQNSKHGDADLKTMASKNISSAILSYECANKASVGPQINQNTAEAQPPDMHSDAQRDTAGHSLKIQSEHSLVCPSCQKLFSSDNNQQYRQHMQMCCGPKYADM